MRNWLVNLLFRLLGNTNRQLYSINYIFGASTKSHEARKIKWEKALVRLWRDKDMLDYLYYHAESDKERAWAGKTDRRMSQGARVRTLFIVYQAHRAYGKTIQRKRSGPDDKDDAREDIKELDRHYKDITEISTK